MSGRDAWRRSRIYLGKPDRAFPMRVVACCLVVPMLLPLLRRDHAIIHRHDRPDSVFIALGRAFPALAHLNLPTPKGASDGEGTLIAPRWVLTAAHVARDIRTGHVVTIHGARASVDSIVIHPDWTDGGPHDLALLRLGTPITATAPAVLYRDSAEVDQLIVIVGYGDYGTGETGPVGNDHVVRGATNRIDAANAAWLTFRFDAPGDPRATELEGVSGPGDSGGPAFMGEGSAARLVGVSSGATGGRRGRYGVVEFYVRVSRYIGWIESITGKLV